MSDGASVYECTSAEDVFDLVQGGQGVFGIAVGREWREVESDLSVLPGVDPADDAALELQDELAARCRSRAAGCASPGIPTRPLSGEGRPRRHAAGPVHGSAGTGRAPC